MSTIAVGDRVRRIKALYVHRTRPDDKEPERLGTVVEVVPYRDDTLVTVEWDAVRDPQLVGGNAKRTRIRGSALEVVSMNPEHSPKERATMDARVVVPPERAT